MARIINRNITAGDCDCECAPPEITCEAIHTDGTVFFTSHESQMTFRMCDLQEFRCEKGIGPSESISVKDLVLWLSCR